MIEVEDLVHRYPDGTVAIDGLSITVGSDEFVVLAGPNGAGKTTLIRHWNGLLEPDSGELRVNGRPVSEDVVAARTAVGMVFQHPRDCFVAGTVGADVAFGPENLGLDREEIDRRVDDALDAVQLAGRHDDRIDRLSGGEQARVAIAGALAMEPDYLVLDEPLAGLDRTARRSVLDRVAALAERGTAIVVVTHDLHDVVDLADRIVVLVDGQLALDAPPDEAEAHLADLGVTPPC